MHQLHFNYKDIFQAPRFAKSVQKMWIQYVGLMIGYFLYIIFTYAAFLSTGIELSAVWIRYGLMPCLFTTGEVYSWYSWALYSVGCLSLLVSFLIAQTAGARSVYVQAKGNNFYIWREAYRFAINKIWSVVLAPLSLIVLVGLMVFGMVLLSWLGQIPIVGELGISLTTFIWFISSLLILYVFIVTIISIILTPQIIATSEEDAFEAIFQAFSISWKQPWRLVIYESCAIFISLFSITALAFFAKKAMLLMNSLFGAFMGPDFINLSNNGQAYAQSCLLMGQNILESVFQHFTPFVYFSHEFILIPTSNLSPSVVIASYLYAASLLFIAGWIISFGLSTFSSGNTLLYLAIRKKKDNVNLLERVDSEESPGETDQDEQKVSENSPAEPTG
jgi:hypothetical protein